MASLSEVVKGAGDKFFGSTVQYQANPDFFGCAGSRDGTVRLWEVQTGRCRKVWSLDTPVKYLAWNPNPDRPLLAVVFGRSVLLMESGTGNETQTETAGALLKLLETATGAADEGAVVRWQKSERAEGLEVVHKHVSGGRF